MTSDDEFKPVWPIPEDGIRYGDAVETAYALADAELEINRCDTTGDGFTRELFIDLVDALEWFDGRLMAIKRVSLIDALDKCFSYDAHDINAELQFEDWPFERHGKEAAENYNKSLRLLVRLLRACREWEATDAKMTMEELIANPLPATAEASDPEPGATPSPQPAAL